MRLKCLLVALALIFLMSSRALAATDAVSPQAAKTLAQLETRYFGFTYDSEPTAARTERLEKLILGQVHQSGTLENRISYICKTVAGSDATDDFENAAVPASTADVAGTRRGQPELSPSNGQSTVQPSSSNTDVTNAGAVPASDDYPHIKYLEDTILGQSFTSQDPSTRLARLENKAFGHASANQALCDRVDSLEQYVQTKLAKKPYIGNSNLSATSAAPGADQSDYPRVDALEKVIVGKVFMTEPLPDRLSRMEVKAFGSASSSDDLSQRTDTLEAYANKHLHKQFVEEQRESETANGSPRPSGAIGKQLLSMVGSSLLGIGTGFGGVGPVGFGGVRFHQRQDDQTQPDAPDIHADDPLISAPTPPPPTAKLLTQVGWCEKQIFGHTFPNMHLLGRLGQLNNELKFETGKSDMELMDNIDVLIKTVQAHKKATQSIGAAPVLPTR